MTNPTAFLLTAALLIGGATVPTARAEQVDAAAPLFEADASTGRIALADYRGKRNVLLAFYFKDFSAG